MRTKRHSKTASQQCRYYEVDNIFEYMVDTYINGNITSFKDIYRELNKGARRDFVDFIFNEVNPKYDRANQANHLTSKRYEQKH